jgi:hypothetical protein
MATRALSCKIDEAEILDVKEVAGVFHMSITDLVKNAIKEYVTELKKTPFYRLTVNVQEVSDEESEEILAAMEEMSDGDLTITSTKHFSV